MLVVDAGTGQNAINQVEMFDEAVGLTGITITKLDGTAKGGVCLILPAGHMCRSALLVLVKKLTICVHSQLNPLLLHYSKRINRAIVLKCCSV